MSIGEFFFIEHNRVCDVEAPYGTEAFITFVIRTVAKKKTLCGSKLKFVIVVRFQEWEAGTTKNFEELVVRNFFKQEMKGNLLFVVGEGILFIRKTATAKASH